MRIQNILESEPSRTGRVSALVATALLGVFFLPLASYSSDAQGAPDIPTATSAIESSPRFVHPLPEGKLTSDYGPAMDPFNKKKRFHTGVDLAAETGTPVRALADGVVTYTTDNFEEAKGSGKVVVVEHGDGWTTRYYHLDGWAVRQGTTVSAGETIGAVGNTGRSTGPHLHFEILRDGEQVNPAEFVRLGN